MSFTRINGIALRVWKLKRVKALQLQTNWSLKFLVVFHPEWQIWFPIVIFCLTHPKTCGACSKTTLLWWSFRKLPNLEVITTWHGEWFSPQWPGRSYQNGFSVRVPWQTFFFFGRSCLLIFQGFVAVVPVEKIASQVNNPWGFMILVSLWCLLLGQFLAKLALGTPSR